MISATNFRIVYITCDSSESASNIARELVVNKLAACCSIIHNATSFFEWENELQIRIEFIIMAKTIDSKLEALQEKVLSLHNDEVPEIIAVEIDKGLDTYLKWVETELI